MNIISPLRKDTVHVPQMGYVLLRFPLANEGLWLLHCHALWHHGVGIGVVIQIGDIEAEAKQKAAALCSNRLGQ